MSDIEILNKVLQATKNKLLTWEKADSDLYEAAIGEDFISIQFKYPLLPDGTTSGADIVHVSVIGLGLTFFSGSEGMKIVIDILAEGMPEWREWIDHISEIKKRTTERLDNLLNNQ